MSSVVDTFESVFEEQGINAVIEVNRDRIKKSTEISVRKEVEDKYVSHRSVVTDESKLKRDDVDDMVRIQAENAARSIREELSEVYRWQDRGIELSIYDGGWAKCERCGTEVEFDLSRSPLANGFELSAPLSPEVTDPLEMIEDDRKKIIRLYLIGLLRDKCDKRCSNSRHGDDLDRKL